MVKVDRSDSLVKEMVAFANFRQHLADDKSFVGVQDIGALKQLISNTSTKKYPTDIYHH